MKGHLRTSRRPVAGFRAPLALPDRVRAVDRGAEDFPITPFETFELPVCAPSLLSEKRLPDDLESVG